MNEYFQFMLREADIVLMGLGIQAMLCFITDSCTFIMRGKKNILQLHYIITHAYLHCRSELGQFPVLEVVVCGKSQQSTILCNNM